MLIPLRQSTAVTLKVGPFVDSTDGFTKETALTIAQADVLLSKNNGAFAQKNDATSATHDAAGYYGVPLNATDSNTLGRLQIDISEAGALPVFLECWVYHPNVYDALFAGTDFLEVASLKPDWAISGATLTVKKRDESTDQFTKTLTATPGADPITAAT